MKQFETLILSTALIGTFLLFIGVINQSQKTVPVLTKVYSERVTITK